MPIGPDQSGIIVSPETSFIHQINPPDNLSKSKSNVPGAGKANASSKKQEGRTSKHNLALRNLRLLADFSSNQLEIYNTES